MESRSYIIFVPFTVIIAVILGIFLSVMGGFIQIQKWFDQYLQSFIMVTGVIAMVLAIVCSFITKSVIYGFSSIVGLSQLIFFIAYGGYTLPHPTGMHFEYIGSSVWSLIVFILYIVFAAINLVISLGCVILSAVGSKKIKSPSKEDLMITYYGEYNFVIGIVGWVLNAIIFWLIPLIF